MLKKEIVDYFKRVYHIREGEKFRVTYPLELGEVTSICYFKDLNIYEGASLFSVKTLFSIDSIIEKIPFNPRVGENAYYYDLEFQMPLCKKVEGSTEDVAMTKQGYFFKTAEDILPSTIERMKRDRLLVNRQV